MNRIIQPDEFQQKLHDVLNELGSTPGCVTGPGRSGAITAAFVSHALGIPFIPFGQACPTRLAPILIIDTARLSGRTLRKAAKKYPGCQTLFLYNEPPIVRFWYEDLKRTS